MSNELDHYQLSDTEFEKQFEACKLDPTLFSHEAHLRLAWIHINNYGIQKAKENIQEQLKSFVTHLGAIDKYHKTLTIIAVQAVCHFMQKSDTNNFKDFIKEFPQLQNDFKSLIDSHYSFDIFSFNEAKSKFIAPDLKPF